MQASAYCAHHAAGYGPGAAMRPPLLLLLLLLGATVCNAKKQPLRLKQSGAQKEQAAPENSLHGAMEAFHRQRVGQLSELSEQQLESKLRQAHAPNDVLDDIRKARYVSRRGRVRLAPKEAMVDALAAIEDAAEGARVKPLSTLVVWARRAGAPAAAVTAALSAGTSAAEARAALTAVGAGSSLSRSSSITAAPSADLLANDAEGLLSLVPPATVDAERLYTMAAQLCESGAELTRLNSQHSALATKAKQGPEFPTPRGIDLARAEREKNIKARDDAKVVPVRACLNPPAPPRARKTTAACRMATVNRIADWVVHRILTCQG